VKALSALHFVQPPIISFFKTDITPHATSRLPPLIVLVRAIFWICNAHGFLLLLPCVALLVGTPVGIPVCLMMVAVIYGKTSIAAGHLCILPRPRLITFVVPTVVVMLMMLDTPLLQPMIHALAMTGPGSISMEHLVPSPFMTLVLSSLGVLLVLIVGPFAVFPLAHPSALWIEKSFVVLFLPSSSTSSRRRPFIWVPQLDIRRRQLLHQVL
jgi:hypothetical protein